MVVVLSWSWSRIVADPVRVALVQDRVQDHDLVHVPAAGAALEVATNAAVAIVQKADRDPDHLLQGTVQDPGLAVHAGPARVQVNPKMMEAIKMAWHLAPDPGLEVPRITKPMTKLEVFLLYSNTEFCVTFGLIRFS